MGLAAECFQNVGASLNLSRFYAPALEFHRKAIRLFQHTRRPAKVAASLVNYTDSLRGLGRYRYALSAIDAAIKCFELFQDTPRTINARLLRVHILLADTNADLSVAESALTEAVPNLTTLGGDVQLESRFLHLRAEIHLRRGAYTEAMSAATDSRERLLSATIAADPVARSYSASLVSDHDRCIAHAKILQGDPVGGFETYERSRVATSAFEDQTAIGVEAIQHTLSARGMNSALLVLQALGPTTYAWTLSSSALEGNPIREIGALSRLLWGFQEQLVRGTLPDRRFDDAFSEEIGNLLPLASLASYGEVLLIPDRILGTLPWAAALVHGRRPFLEAAPLLTGIYPNLSMAASSLRRPSRTMRKCAVIVGNPMNSNPSLPGAEREARAIAALLRTAGWDVHALIGATVSRAAVVAALAAVSPSLVVIASHGKVNHLDPMKTGLWLGGQTHSEGTLTVEQILADRGAFASIDALWLNTCEGATTPMMLLDSQLSIAGAFLNCGIACVAANLWSVYDTAALALSLLFFSEMTQGRSVAEAVAAAQRAMSEGRIQRLEDLPNWASGRGTSGEAVAAALRGAGAFGTRPPSVLRSLVGWGALTVIGDGSISVATE